jgi:hypothetical protein
MGSFAEFPLDAPEALEKLEKRIADTTDLALRFMNAAEEFIAAVLGTDGWEMH